MGLLTTLPRDEWATLRERIESTDAQNAATLETIDSALFALSLEDTEVLRLDSCTAARGEGSWNGEAPSRGERHFAPTRTNRSELSARDVCLGSPR